MAIKIIVECDGRDCDVLVEFYYCPSCANKMIATGEI